MSLFPETIDDPELTIVSDEEDIMPDMVVERENISPEEVFKKEEQIKEEVQEVKEVPKVKPIKDGPKLTKTGKVRKPMSEEHRKKLQIAREKGLAFRRSKAKEKKELKDLEEKAKKKKYQLKKKELEDILQEDEPSAPAPAPAPAPVQQPISVNANIDPDIIQKAIDDALTKAEMMRQQRKKEKKEKQSKEIAEAKAQELIRQAVYPPKQYYGDAGFFSKNVFFTQ